MVIAFLFSGHHQNIQSFSNKSRVNRASKWSCKLTLDLPLTHWFCCVLACFIILLFLHLLEEFYFNHKGNNTPLWCLEKIVYMLLRDNWSRVTVSKGDSDCLSLHKKTIHFLYGCWYFPSLLMKVTQKRNGG